MMDNEIPDDIIKHWYVPGSLEDGIRDSEALQHDIDIALQNKSVELCIKLDHGSEVTDLKSCVDLRVQSDGEKFRYFSIICQEWAGKILVIEPSGSEHSQFYAIGHPLIIVKIIDGETIVRSVLYYLEREESLSNQ